MEEIIGFCSIPQCRLCAIHGFHKVDIFDGNTNELANKIFRCVGIRVNQLTLFSSVNKITSRRNCLFVPFSGEENRQIDKNMSKLLRENK